jgi:hypothetical protein
MYGTIVFYWYIFPVLVARAKKNLATLSQSRQKHLSEDSILPPWFACPARLIGLDTP